MIRHVAVLAVAAVMLTAIAVPAQGERPTFIGRPGNAVDFWTINVHCYGDPMIDSWWSYAWDVAKPGKPELLIVNLAEDGVEIARDEDSGVGEQLEVEFYVPIHPGHVYVGRAILFLLDRDTGDPIELIEVVSRTIDCTTPPPM